MSGDPEDCRPEDAASVGPDGQMQCLQTSSSTPRTSKPAEASRDPGQRVISWAVKVKCFTRAKVTQQVHPAEEGGGGGDSCAGELAEDLVSYFS